VGGGGGVGKGTSKKGQNGGKRHSFREREIFRIGGASEQRGKKGCKERKSFQREGGAKGGDKKVPRSFGEGKCFRKRKRNNNNGGQKKSKERRGIRSCWSKSEYLLTWHQTSERRKTDGELGIMTSQD